MNTNHQKTITMKTLRKTILAAALALVGFVAAMPAQAQQWAGSYMAEHEAGETAGGSYIGYIMTLELNYLADGNYTGTMQIDGYMTMVRANVYAKETGKTVTVYYDTPRPDVTGYYQAKYRVRWMSRPPEWGKWEYDDDDGGAGNDTDQLDMIELTIVPC